LPTLTVLAETAIARRPLPSLWPQVLRREASPVSPAAMVALIAVVVGVLYLGRDAGASDAGETAVMLRLTPPPIL
jgi:hypothetical protein